MTQIPEDLIIRFINNSCSNEELVAVKNWLDESEENATRLFELEQTALYASSLQSNDSQRERLEAKITECIAAGDKQMKQKARHRFISIATSAAAMIAVVIMVGIYFMHTPDIRMIHVASTTESISVTLPDSTVVFLNKDSYLTYPETFASNSREVELRGEGYFEVSHDCSRPFKVTGKYLTVEVLGTQFNFVSRDTTRNSVSLIEGSVEVFTDNQKEGVVLNPGQKAIYSVATGHLTIRNANTAADASWHDKIIPFDNANLKEIVEILQQLYDTEILLDNSVDLNKTYSGVTIYCESLDSTLTLLSNSIPIRFSNKDHKTIIYSK